MPRGRTLLIATTTALLMLALPASAQDAADVDVADVTFEPAEVTIDVGGEVTWTQTGSLPHSVTADDGSFDSHPDCAGGSDCMAAGDTFSMTFDEPGEYAYYCKIHGGPGGAGMSGVVTVVAADATASETTAPTEEPTEEASTVSGSISVADQSGDGTSVSVDSVEISGGNGFVVVHADADGAPGPVLGHVAVTEGTSTDVEVPLDDALDADATVWPMLHVDAGTAGTYEFPGADGPVTVDGQVVVASLDYTVTSETDTAADDLPQTGAGMVSLAIVAGLVLLAGGLVLRRSGAATER